MSYQRIKGGEKNLKTGVKWTKDEIIKVYRLFKKLNGVGLHEHNPEIQQLAHELGRTVRSTEAQALMFRNLERLGIYSHGNMNKLSREVWQELELNRNKYISNSLKSYNSNEPDLFSNKDDVNRSENAELSFLEWNKKLIEYYFHPGLDNREITCFLVYKELFEEITDHKFTFLDFELSIEKELNSTSFVKFFKSLYSKSIHQKINGKNLRKPIPEYFGLLIYLIYSLTEASNKNLRITNVYDRINNIGKKRFGKSWGKINSEFSRDILENVWKDLEYWSTNFKLKKLGYFTLHDPKNSQRKYVSRIERHALLNSGHFQQIFDVLIEIGIVPKESISKDRWIDLFNNNLKNIRTLNKVREYLSEYSSLRDSILKFINDYFQNHYTDKIIASDSSSVRNPAIPLLLCINELPQWDNKIRLKDIYYRAFSSELENDQIEYKGNSFDINHEFKEYSKKIRLELNPTENTILFKGSSQRFAIKNTHKWFLLNRNFEEWVETLVPTNGLSILLLVNSVNKDLIDKSTCSIDITYNSPWPNYYFLQFENLDETEFQALNSIIGNKQKIEGKIELLGDFLYDRRRLILKEFGCVFKYIGPVSNPRLLAKCVDEELEWELNKTSDDSGTIFSLSNDIPNNLQFYIYEGTSNVKSHFSYSIGSVRLKEIINVVRPYSKDQDGINIIEREIQSDDIFDIPNDFNRKNFDTVQFNTWHNNLWKIFKPGKTDYITKDKNNFLYKSHHRGEKLLNYLSVVNNIDTYKLPSLIRELNPEIDSKFSKRIMHYWRDLGYINFETYGEKIKVSPSNLLFIETQKGLKAFLTGFRNEALIKKLTDGCRELGLIIQLTNHSEKYKEILPFRIEIYDKLGNLANFKTLAKKVGIQYINNIENPLNRSFAIYQLACFYTQRSVDEFDDYLKTKLQYKTDHHRKLIFESGNCLWKETNKNVSSMKSPVLIRYDGFMDRQMIHIYKDENSIKKLDDFSLCIFKLLKDGVFLQKRHRVYDVSDFYVPLNLSLPYWIERGLLMMNAKIPDLETFENKSYRIYRNIHDDIIELIGAKLNQQSKIIG